MRRRPRHALAPYAPNDEGGGSSGDAPSVGGGGDDASLQAQLRALLGPGAEGFYPLAHTAVSPEQLLEPAAVRDPALGEELRRLAESVSAAEQSGAGRVLLVADDQRSPAARAFVAGQVARQAAARQRRVLLVDGDFRHGQLSRALGQEDHVGLIDMARYGASLRSASQDIGMDGVTLVGVGSFRPDESDPCSDEELTHALAQLRAFAECVLLVAPARLADGSFNPLIAYVDGALLAVTLRDPAQALFEPTLQYLRGLDIPVVGVAVFTRGAGTGAPAAEPRERLETAAPAARAPLHTPAGDTRASEGPAAAPANESSPGASAAFDEEPHDAVGPAIAAAVPERARATDSATARAVEPASRASSSTFFRIVILIMASVLLAFVVWWRLVERAERKPPTVAGNLPTAPSAEGASAPVSADPAAAPATGGTDAPATTPQEQPPAPPEEPPPSSEHRPSQAEVAFPEEEIPAPDASQVGSAAGPTAGAAGAAAGRTPAGAEAGASPPATTPAATTGAGASPAGASRQPPAGATKPSPAPAAAPAALAPGGAPASTGAGPASSGSPAAPVPAELQERLRRAPANGYSLHPWSFPDSSEALSAAAKLAREGMQPTVRGAMVAGRRWYRVLVGDFTTRAQAADARALLLQRRDVREVAVLKGH